MDPIPRTIREQVTDHIRDQVVAGELPPGKPLRETEFAERFRVSRGPIRDAFLRLTQEGLLAYQPNRGVTVCEPPSPGNRPLITSLRFQIESFVVKRGLRELAESDLAEIELRLGELESACASEDAAAVARCDVTFHEELLVRCGGGGFLPIWRWLCSQMLMTYGRLENYHEVHGEHAEILRAVRSGRRSDAVAALKANIQ